MLSLPATEPGFDYSSYEMLEYLGESQVSSIRRYDFILGWQTTSWFMGIPTGEDFITSRGEGYLIYMKEAQLDWRPY